MRLYLIAAALAAIATAAYAETCSTTCYDLGGGITHCYTSCTQ